MSDAIQVNENYLEQLERVKRYLWRMEEISKGVQHIKRDDFLTDDVLSFFVHVHSLKDWVEKSRNEKFSYKKTNDFINSKRNLKICADLANGIKHLIRDKSDRSGENPKISGRHITLEHGSGAYPLISISYFIKTNTGCEDALEIAKGAVADWECFLFQ